MPDHEILDVDFGDLIRNIVKRAKPSLSTMQEFFKAVILRAFSRIVIWSPRAPLELQLAPSAEDLQNLPWRWKKVRPLRPIAANSSEVVF
jgi:hypothetical protein